MRYRYLVYKYTQRGHSESAFHDVWGSFGSWPFHSMSLWRPPTDIYETQDMLIVIIELAGVSEDNVTITLFSDLLVVEGTREQPLDMDACHQLGIKYGDFRSEINVHTQVDQEKVEVEYKNGMLKIALRKL